MSTTSLMTFAEFERLPDLPGRQELVDGELIHMPPPDLQHSQVSKRILRMLLNTVDESLVWPDHTGYRIGGGWIEPDVSVSWPDQRRDDKYFIGSPMIAVEILSPGEDIERKLTLYFAEDAFEVWVIDVRHKTMTVYLRRNHEVVRLPIDQEYHSEGIQMSVPLSQLFS
jgi:Uma2 family endonuclease